MVSLKKIGINQFQLERLPGMKAEAMVYIKPEMVNQVSQDLSLSQLAEAAMLPGVISPVVGMPDIHQGFGLPIGGVMATNGLISAGAVGMDINCGVRLLSTNLEYEAKLFSSEALRTIIHIIERTIPIGLGQERKSLPSKVTLEGVVSGGAKFLVQQGYGSKEDLESIEENGRMDEARYEALSKIALKRSEKEIGTLGSGNHFIEIQKIDEVIDQTTAQAWGLRQNQICLMIHCGSRALGHQTCMDYTTLFWRAKEKYHLEIPRKGLAAVPIDSPEGKDYFGAMAGAVNYAFANRHLIMSELERVLTDFFKAKGIKVEFRLIYDLAHNIAKWETHRVMENGKWKMDKVLIHRKGATRALPAGHPQNPAKYQVTGHPAIVPGSMGTPSYILLGLPKAQETWFSVNHGSGRAMSRTMAKRTISEAEFKKTMGEVVYNLPFEKIADEAPSAYKNIEDVVDTLVEAGITKKVVKLKPLAVVKGD